MLALGPERHGALWRPALSSPPGGQQGCTDSRSKGRGARGSYSLAMAKGFSTSILPQSAIVTSFRGLSRPSVLVLSTLRTTSWGGRQSVKGSAAQRRRAPVYGRGGLRATWGTTQVGLRVRRRKRVAGEWVPSGLAGTACLAVPCTLKVVPGHD
uniref:Uncharacterized protein n=1 Tax=Sus scrofa TaxID=9823 RepID=A0A4X1TZQ5_PIG